MNKSRVSLAALASFVLCSTMAGLAQSSSTEPLTAASSNATATATSSGAAEAAPFVASFDESGAGGGQMPTGSPANPSGASSEIFVGALRMFPKMAFADTITEQADQSSGLTLGYRLNFSPRSGVEGRYGFSRTFENYTFLDGSTASIQANIHELTGAYVFNFLNSNDIQAAVLGGGGALIFSPTSQAQFDNPGVSRQTRGTFLYGVSVDVPLFSKVYARVEYRGFIFKPPDFGFSDLTTGTWTHVAEPAAGVVFRF